MVILGGWVFLMSEVTLYRGYSKLRTHTAIRPYGRSIPRSIGPP